MEKIRVWVPTHYKIVNGRKFYVSGHYKWVEVNPWNVFSTSKRKSRRYRW
jgi:hypothetical protein